MDLVVLQLLQSLYFSGASSLTQGCHSVSLSFSSSAFRPPLSSVSDWCLCSDVLCDNPGNCCGNSPIATVFIVTPTPKSAQVIVNRKSLIISLSSLFPVHPSAVLAVHYCNSIKHNVFIKDLNLVFYFLRVFNLVVLMSSNKSDLIQFMFVLQKTLLSFWLSWIETEVCKCCLNHGERWHYRSCTSIVIFRSKTNFMCHCHSNTTHTVLTCFYCSDLLIFNISRQNTDIC